MVISTHHLILYGGFCNISNDFIGLRHQVGGDWGSYQVYFDLLSYKDLDEIFDVRHDMGYAGLNWFVSKIGYDIYLVNFICALVFFNWPLLFMQKSS